MTMVKQAGSMVVKIAIFLGLYLLVFEAQKWVMASNETYKRLLETNVPIWLLINFSVLYLLLIGTYYIRNVVFKQSAKKTLFEAASFRPLRGQHLLLSLIVGLGCALVFLGLMRMPFLPQIALDQMRAYVDIFGTAQQFVFVVIGVGLAGAFMEEIFFRGLVFNKLRGVLPFVVAYIIQALIYSIFQPNLTISVISFFLALIYGIIYTATGTVWSTISIAVLVNVLIVSAKETGLVDLLQQGSLISYVMLVLGIVCIVVATWRIAKNPQGQDQVQTVISPKAKPYWVMLGRVGLYVIIYFAILQPLVHLWYNVMTEIEAIRPWLTDVRNSNWGLVLNDFIAIPIYMFILKRYQGRNLIQVCKFNSIPRRSIPLIAILSICMGLWVTSIVKIPVVGNTFPQFDLLLGSLAGGPVFTFITFLIVHSIYKEVLFRGLVFNELNAVLPLGFAIAGNAVIYGLLFFQLDPALTLYGGMGTIIFALLYVWFRSIWASIVAEIGLFGTYYVARSVYSYYEIGFNWYFVAIIAICSIAVPPLMYRIWKLSKQQEVAAVQTGTIQLGAGGR